MKSLLKRRQTKESFLKRVRIKSTGCWHFKGASDSRGYGKVGLSGKVVGAHRASWILHNGEIVGDLLVCHKCDNPRCVNPEHLFLGTHQDNMQDMINKGRAGFQNGIGGGAKKDFCKKGHEYLVLGFYLNHRGHKNCKQCSKDRYNKELRHNQYIEKKLKKHKQRNT